jgi:glycosyltransferase involved in cell wall biosynthesis
VTSLAHSRLTSVAVVVPCLNEAACLPYVLGKMPTDVNEVILVDGGSVDGSVEVAERCYPSVKVVQQSRTGKGNALACGFDAATSDLIVTLDGDGSADPAEIPRFVAALQEGADFAKGSRFLGTGGSDDITRLRRLGNDGLTVLVNRLYGRRFTDLCYGYNAFWRSALPALRLPAIDGGVSQRGDGFEIETLMILRAAGARLRIVEVPSHEAHRIHGVSNLNAYRDGRRVLDTILAEYRAMRSGLLAEAPVSPAPVTPSAPSPARTWAGRGADPGTGPRPIRHAG